VADLKGKNDNLFDNRIIQRNIRDGLVGREQYDNFIKSLPDLLEQCEDISEDVYRSKKPGVLLTGDFVSHENDEE
jgi:hypothetical protein